MPDGKAFFFLMKSFLNFKIRKVRWALQGKGKSGGIRIVYLDVLVAEKIYLLSVFAKNEKANLSKAERNDFKNLVALIKQEAKNGK